MKAIYYSIIILLITSSISFGQNNSVNAINSKKYKFVESYNDNNYASSITFNRNKKEDVKTILNKYFAEVTVSGSVTTWKSLKDNKVKDDIFIIKLKNRDLKIEWKSKINTSNSTCNRLKKISAEIIESIK